MEASNCKSMTGGLLISGESSNRITQSKMRTGRGHLRVTTTLTDDSDVKVLTAFSIGVVHRVFSSFSGEKKRIVESIGFAGLMKLHPQSRFSRLLVLRLVRNMDPVTGTIRLPNGEELTVAEEDVEMVLGIPRGQNIISTGMAASQKSFDAVKAILMIKQEKEITLASLERILLKDYGLMMSTRERDAFKVAAVLYADAYFLAPKGAKAKINQELFRFVSQPEFIEGFNWCHYVLKVLIDSTRRAQSTLRREESKVTLDGCLFFWLVYYIDNVDFGVRNSTQEVLPRVIDFPYETVKELAGDDKCRTGLQGITTFEQNKLRLSNDVIYSRNNNEGSRNERIRNMVDMSTIMDEIRGIEEESTIICILDKWSANVKKATASAREALLANLTNKDGIKKCNEYSKGDVQNRGVRTPRTAKLTVSILQETKCTSLNSEENIEIIEVSDGENTPQRGLDDDSVQKQCVNGREEHIDPLEETSSNTVNENVGQQLQTYQDDIIRRLSGIGLAEHNNVGKNLHLWEESSQIEHSMSIRRELTTEAHKGTRAAEDFLQGDKKLLFEEYEQISPIAMVITTNDLAVVTIANTIADEKSDRCDKQQLLTETDESRTIGLDITTATTLEGAANVDEYNTQLSGVRNAKEIAGDESDWRTKQHSLTEAAMDRTIDGVCDEIAEYHTPLCMVRNARTIAATDAVQKVNENELLVDDSYMDPDSKFGISPFTINLTHEDAPLSCQFKLEKDLKSQNESEKKRTWYKNTDQPQVEITGEFLQQMFTAQYDLTVSAMNNIVKMLREMDDEIYSNWRQKRWRHFMTVEFAVISINGWDKNNQEQLEDMAKMFQGSTKNYNVGECRLILAPLMVGWHWSLYAWDFERKKIMVLDPLHMNLDRESMAQKHNLSLKMMHRAMCQCRHVFFEEQIDSEEKWETEYVTITGATCDSYNSGIFTMFYARYFDGEFITRVLTKAASRLQKLNILYQILTTNGNEGQPPAWMMERETKKTSGVDFGEVKYMLKDS